MPDHPKCPGSPGDEIFILLIFFRDLEFVQVSWIISSEVTHIVSGETVHQEKDGSFVTMSTMNLFIPDTEHAEDVVVECVAKHDTLLHEDIAAVHIIKVSSKKSGFRSV